MGSFASAFRLQSKFVPGSEHATPTRPAAASACVAMSCRRSVWPEAIETAAKQRSSVRNSSVYAPQWYAWYVEADGLERFDGDWAAAIAELADEMHEVDRDACSIWFQFFPLGLHELLQGTADHNPLERFYQFRGAYRLSDVADTSSWFLYGHRYWPEVKGALREVPRGSLLEVIRALASKVRGPMDLTLPISAIGLMTLRQVGFAFLDAHYAPPEDRRSAEEVLRQRASDAKSGWFSRPKPRIVIDERQSHGWFPLTPGQHITTAAEQDKRPYNGMNQRCLPGNGPIPVDCRSGSCGTCWVGILGGNDKLAPVDEFERKRMEYFGYWESAFHRKKEERPLIRLACQSVAKGSCSIVIPSWNGVWSRTRRAAFERQH